MQYQERLTARQLGAVNDSACALIVDPYIGINSRKFYYRPPVKNQSKLKHIIQRLIDGKVNEDEALSLLLAREEAKRKIRQLTTYLDLNEEQIGQYYKIYLIAFKSAPNFRLTACDDPKQGGLRAVAARSFHENDIIPGLIGIVASTQIATNANTTTDVETTKSKKNNTNHLTSVAENGGANLPQQPLLQDKQQEEFLLLGPAAFVNHCCAPNASLRRLKGDKIILSALRGIEAGDEITVSYGPDSTYSGENDEDDPCECSKCNDTKLELN